MRYLLAIIAALTLFTSWSHADTHFKISHQYKCYSTIDSHMVLLTVNLNNMNVKVMVQKNLADFDPSYTAKTGDKLRYVYEESDEGQTEVILQSQLRDGMPSGLMAIQTRGEGFSRTAYTCYLLK